MSRQDPGAANGGPIREPGRCGCGHRVSFHKPTPQGRGPCSASTCMCRSFKPKESP